MRRQLHSLSAFLYVRQVFRELTFTGNNLLMIFLSCLLIGCGAHRVIRTDPPGASITVDEERVGQSPVTYEFSTSGFRFNYKVRAELNGYHPAEELVRPYTDFWGTISWPDVFITLRKMERDSEERNRDLMLRNDNKPLPASELNHVVNSDVAREKLKNSFEKKYITIDQLKKANNELQSQSLSRTLRAFIDGSIDEQTFGALY